MKLDQLVKLYGRQEDVAELAALRARVAELESAIASDAKVDIANLEKISALTARVAELEACAVDDDRAERAFKNVSDKLDALPVKLAGKLDAMTARAESAERKVAAALAELDELDDPPFRKSDFDHIDTAVRILRKWAVK